MIRKVNPKTKSVSQLRDKLDAVYSQWIRRSAADPKGTVKCYTCPKVDHWKNLQCGHYISRRHMSTRWFEKNTKVQCVGCNVFNQGNGPAFSLALVREYGPTILEELEIKKNNICKMGKFEYELLIQEYTQKLKQLDAA